MKMLRGEVSIMHAVLVERPEEEAQGVFTGCVVKRLLSE